MKKITISGVILILFALLLTSAGCSKDNTPATAKKSAVSSAETEKKQEKTVYKVKLGNTLLGNILAFIADDSGIFKEEGIEPEFMTFQSSADGLNAIMVDALDVGMIYGCAYPLLYITKGVDFTIFGGYMSGGYPVVAFEGTFKDGYKGLESFVGKTVALARNYTPDLVWHIAMQDAGYVEDVDYKIIYGSNQSETLQMVLSKKADVTLAAWSMYQSALNAGLQVYDWSNNLWDHTHVCCRLVANTKWINENPARTKALLRAFLRAEKRYEADKNYVKALWIKLNKMGEEQAQALTYDIPFEIEADPKANGVKFWWDKLHQVKFMDTAKIDLFANHMNIALYKEALDELLKENPNDPFYTKLQKRYLEYNSKMLE